MIGRTPAEVVKDLRDAAEMLAQIDKYASGLICHTAADLIERLTGENERLAREVLRTASMVCPYVVSSDEGTGYCALNHDAEFEIVEAALPDCPTCGGEMKVLVGVPHHLRDCDCTWDQTPCAQTVGKCPDCVDGKVSPAQLAALWQAVHDRMLFVTLDPEDVWTPKQNLAIERVIAYLRAVRPT